MTSHVISSAVEPADARTDSKLASCDTAGNDQLVHLHRELSDAAVAASAHTARIVWAQVKGFPFWPAQILLAKDAKIKFRDTAQEYTDKRMATQSPVLFFVTKEISWVHTKQIKSWGQGMADGCHTKNRSSQKFRQALVQVGDLLLGRKSAPAGFTKPQHPAVCSMPPVASIIPKERRSDPSSPDQAAPSGSASATKPKPKLSSAAEQFAEQQERSRIAILGGMSRDERHRRRTEGRTSDSAVQSQPSRSEAPQTAASPRKESPESPKQHTESRRNASLPLPILHVEQAPSVVQPASTAPAAPLSADPSTAHTEQRRLSSDGVLLKRHTRSQGTAELGASDLQNLEPRKAPRRALSCAAPAATSCMGSRGTGDGATGRPPATDTPRSVGTHPPPGPFADGQPSASSAPPAVTHKLSHEAHSTPVQQVQKMSVKEGSPLPSGIDVDEAAGGNMTPSHIDPPVSSAVPAMGKEKCTSAASHVPANIPEAAVPSIVSKIAPEFSQAPDDPGVDEGHTSAHAVASAAPVSRSDAGGCQHVETAECPMVDVSQPTADPPALQHASDQEQIVPEKSAADDSTRGTRHSQEDAPYVALPAVQARCKSPPVATEARCATISHAEAEAASGMLTYPSADAEVDEQAYSSVEQADDMEGSAQMQEGRSMQVKEELERDEVMHPVIKSVEPQQRNGTVEQVLQQAPSSVIDSGPEQREEAGADSRSMARPSRRAAMNRKNALELVRGDTARGTSNARNETLRTSRTGEAAARSQTARKSGGALPSRKRSLTQAVSPEAGGVSRTRARGGGGGLQTQDASRGPLPDSLQAGFPGTPAAPSQLAVPSAALPDVPAAAAPPLGDTTDELRNRSLEQLAVLQARAADKGLNADEHRLMVQLAEFVRGYDAQVQVAAPVSSAIPQEETVPISSAEALRFISAVLSAPQHCPPHEFWLPAELYLMRNVPHQHIDVNRYPASIRPKKLKPQQISVCNCTRDPRYTHRDTFCCGDGCLNRTSHLLCDVRSCPCRGDCKNKPFNLRRPPAVAVRLTDSRGSGLVAKEPIPAGAFVVEYTGEVIPEKDRWERMMTARKRGAVHFYIMELSKGLYIDAEHIGSNARFMNSSCDPNCETQKWKDASTGETRIGLFTTRAVREDEELTYDYQFQHAGLHAAAQGFRCMCGSANCRGTMDVNPERSRDMGRRLRVKWDGDEKWYEGYVLRFNPSNGKHTVYYPVEGSNGTQETLSLDDVEFEWIEDQLLPLGPSQQTATAPGTHPALPPAAQVQGVLQQAAAVAMLPINPKTGRIVGEAAKEATLARNEASDAKLPASRSGSQRECLLATTLAAVAQMPTNVQGPVQSGSSIPKGNAGVRVALPRPLPPRPLADEAVAAEDGLELLSAVAASLPERAQSPQPEPARSGKNGVTASVLPTFAVLALLPPKLPLDVTLSDALPAADSAPVTNHSAANTTVQPIPPRAAVSGVLAAQKPAGVAVEAAAVPRQPAVPPTAAAAAAPAVCTVSPDLGSHSSRVLPQAAAASVQLQNPYSPQLAASKLPPVQARAPTEARAAAHVQPGMPTDAAQLQQALLQAANLPPDKQQQLAASMKVLMQAVSQPFAASPALQQQQRQHMLMQVAASLSNAASKQKSSLQQPEALNTAAPAQMHSATSTATQLKAEKAAPSPVQVPGMHPGSSSAVLTEQPAGASEYKDLRWSGHGPRPQVADGRKSSHPGAAEPSKAQHAACLSSHASAFDALVEPPNGTAQAAGLSHQGHAQTHDAAAVVAAAQTLRSAQNVAANPAAAAAVRDALAAVVSGSAAVGAAGNAPSTQVSSSGEEAAAALHMPAVHPHSRALAAAVVDADRNSHVPHPLAFAQQMPHPQHTASAPSSIPALLATARAAATEAHLPANQRASAQCAHAPVARAAVAPPAAANRPPADGHFANAALTAANAAAAAPSSAQHWLVRLNVPESAVRAWIVHAGQKLGIADPLHESQRPRCLQFLNQLQYSMQLQQRHVQLQLSHMASQDAGRAAAVGAAPDQSPQAQQAVLQPTSL